jgi:hypothetical protein
MDPLPLTPRFLLAVRATHALHGRQARKGTRIPYLGHLLGVASIVLQFGGDEELAIAGLLHDAAEDQGGDETLAKIRRAFGERVAAIVDGCSDTTVTPKPPWLERKKQYVAGIAAKDRDVVLVSAADKLDNARAIDADLRDRGRALAALLGREGLALVLRRPRGRLPRSRGRTACKGPRRGRDGDARAGGRGSSVPGAAVARVRLSNQERGGSLALREAQGERVP